MVGPTSPPGDPGFAARPGPDTRSAPLREAALISPALGIKQGDGKRRQCFAALPAAPFPSGWSMSAQCIILLWPGRTIGQAYSSQKAAEMTTKSGYLGSFLPSGRGVLRAFRPESGAVGRQRTPQLLGREQALGQLAAARERVGPDGGALALVSGEAGIGKTRLLEEFAARNADALVARGGCVEGVAYAPWTDALWWLIDRIGPDVVDELPPVVAAQLGRLIPSLALTEPVADDDGGQQLLFEAVVTLLRRAATRMPLVLVVDDMHWIDPASRELLRHVAGNLRRVPILLVVAFRVEDSAAERDLIAHLGRLGEERVTLERLPDDTTAEIATLLLGGDAPTADVERIAHDAGGNPLFVEELVAAAGTKGIPETLRDLMLARFSSLDDDARHLVRIAAVMGARSPRAWLAGASELSADRARAATRAAADAGVLVADEGAYEFRHALLRQAVLDELLPDETVELHRTIASALTEHPEYAVGVDRTAELARHWDAAEEPDPRAQMARRRRAARAGELRVSKPRSRRTNAHCSGGTRSRTRRRSPASITPRCCSTPRMPRALPVTSNAPPTSLVPEWTSRCTVDLDRVVDAASRAYPLLWAAGRAPDLFDFANTKSCGRCSTASIRLTRARFLVTQVEHLVENANRRRPAGSRRRRCWPRSTTSTIPPSKARAHIASAWCSEAFGDYDTADLEYERAADVAREVDAHSMLALVLVNHASFKMSVPDLAVASRCSTRSTSSSNVTAFADTALVQVALCARTHHVPAR